MWSRVQGCGLIDAKSGWGEGAGGSPPDSPSGAPPDRNRRAAADRGPRRRNRRREGGGGRAQPVGAQGAVVSVGVVEVRCGSRCCSLAFVKLVVAELS